ncbi:hypothetical protein F5877DRAFT_85564 [Lentinula edodes]|nr:hypothetical protein F5877DRAFT_85564 [Lentinula edodes]
MSLPSSESTPSTYGMTSNANTHTSSPPAHKVKEVTSVDSDVDDDLMFISMVNKQPPSVQQPSQKLEEVALSDHKALRQAHLDLENRFQNALDKIKALEDAVKARNNCTCCLEVMLQPFILLCGHTFCRECLLRLSDVYLKAKMNLVCPDCRTIQGRFTPIPNYVSQSSVDQMLQSEGFQPPSRPPLQWPLRFRSGPVSLPFPRRNGTYPVSTPAWAPATFPVVNDHDE